MCSRTTVILRKKAFTSCFRDRGRPGLSFPHTHNRATSSRSDYIWLRRQPLVMVMKPPTSSSSITCPRSDGAVVLRDAPGPSRRAYTDHLHMCSSVILAHRRAQGLSSELLCDEQGHPVLLGTHFAYLSGLPPQACGRAVVTASAPGPHTRTPCELALLLPPPCGSAVVLAPHVRWTRLSRQGETP